MINKRHKNTYFIFISIFSLFVLLVVFNNKISFPIDKNTPEFVFLSSVKDLKADFKQKQYTQKNIEESYGKILIKKPDNILLEHNSQQMRIKILSVNGNVKMIDKDTQQTTYFDNQYSELMQFFTNNLKAEKLFLSKNKEVCMNFKNLDTDWIACLNIDLNSQTIKTLSLYAIIEENIKNNNSNKIKPLNIVKSLDIIFKNVVINKGVDDNKFYIKDSRIFDDDE